MFDAESGNGMMGTFEETEEEMEIELNDAEPAFLRGQTRLTKELSPVRIVANPDGSLNRAAITQNQLAKERRELKQAQANSLIDSIPKDLNRPWEDPMPDAGERGVLNEITCVARHIETLQALFGSSDSSISIFCVPI